MISWWMSAIIVLVIMAIGTPLIFKYLPKNETKKPSFNVELKCKDYIEQHSKNYSKEQIKQALLTVGVSENDADIFLKKYYLEN